MVSNSTSKTTTITIQPNTINFFEACERLSKPHGRVGMLIPWSFMFRKSFQKSSERRLRRRAKTEISSLNFGWPILDNDIVDNATGCPLETVFRPATSRPRDGNVHSGSRCVKEKKKQKFIQFIIRRVRIGGPTTVIYVTSSEFDMVPGTSISYWVPKNIRELYTAETVLRCR